MRRRSAPVNAPRSWPNSSLSRFHPRPVTITALTAILGLLPAAISTAIGSQTQRPLAIVVVGGMTMTLFLDRYLMPVLYNFYGDREPPKDAASLSH